MAIAITQLGTVQTTRDTFPATVTIPIGSNVPAGSTIEVMLDNQGGGRIDAVDTAGNAYTFPSGGWNAHLGYGGRCVNCLAVTAGSEITITVQSSIAPYVITAAAYAITGDTAPELLGETYAENSNWTQAGPNPATLQLVDVLETNPVSYLVGAAMKSLPTLDNPSVWDPGENDTITLNTAGWTTRINKLFASHTAGASAYWADESLAVFSRIEAGSHNPSISVSFEEMDGAAKWRKVLRLFRSHYRESAPPAPPGKALTFTRNPGDRRLVLARATEAGALLALLFNDSVPDVLVSTVTVESADVTGAHVRYRRSGVLDLLYCQSGTVKQRVSRDQGSTWSVATTVATGYQEVTWDLDERTGLLGAAVYDSAAETWKITCGTLDSAGTTWSFSTPATLVTGAKGGAHLRRTPAGVWEFAYTTTGNVVTIIRCRSLGADGSGTWS